MAGSIGRNGKATQTALRLLKPGQVRRNPKDIKAYAAAYSEELIDALFNIATDEEVFPRDRILAAEAVLNRAHGKPNLALPDDSYDATIIPEKLPTSTLTQMLKNLQAEDGIIIDESLLQLPAPDPVVIEAVQELEKEEEDGENN